MANPYQTAAGWRHLRGQVHSRNLLLRCVHGLASCESFVQMLLAFKSPLGTARSGQNPTPPSNEIFKRKPPVTTYSAVAFGPSNTQAHRGRSVWLIGWGHDQALLFISRFRHPESETGRHLASEASRRFRRKRRSNCIVSAIFMRFLLKRRQAAIFFSFSL